MTPEDLEEEDEGWVGLARVEALSSLSPASEQAECGLVRAAGGCHWAHAMNRSTPGLPVHHQLPEFTQTHVHRVSDALAVCTPSAPEPSAKRPGS